MFISVWALTSTLFDTSLHFLLSLFRSLQGALGECSSLTCGSGPLLPGTEGPGALSRAGGSKLEATCSFRFCFFTCFSKPHESNQTPQKVILGERHPRDNIPGLVLPFSKDYSVPFIKLMT